MLKAIISSFKEVLNPANRKIFYLSILLTILSYIILVSSISYLLAQIQLFDINWLNTTINILGGILTALGGIFLLPAAISAFSELFSSAVIINTEKNMFKKLPSSQPINTLNSLFYTLSFSFKSAFFILGMMLAYLITFPFMAIPVFGLVLGIGVTLSFYFINAFIIGKGYYDTVAMRYMNIKDKEVFWYQHRIKLVFTGLIISFLYTLPFINLIAPIYSFALMTQVFWHLKSQENKQETQNCKINKKSIAF